MGLQIFEIFRWTCLSLSLFFSYLFSFLSCLYTSLLIYGTLDEEGCSPSGYTPCHMSAPAFDNYVEEALHIGHH